MYYFASDIHLGAGCDEAARMTENRFVEWLDAVSADAKTIFLVGDLFDFWFEYRHVVPKGFTRTLGKIAFLTDKGIRVVFFTGNHDMWVRDYLRRECGMEIYTSPRQMRLAGKNVFIAHGDNMNIGDKPILRLLNAIFRSKILYAVFSWLVHPDIMLKFGHWWSGKSRKSRSGASTGENVTQPLIDYAAEYKEAHPETDCFIFGHMHVPRDYSTDGLRVVTLGAWAGTPAYARLDGDGNLFLEKFER